MKCVEVKNLIIEATNLNELLEETGIKSHLNSCKSCQEKYDFEKKIRLSFSSIAEEAPPVSLTKSILEIHNSQNTTSVWETIKGIFFSFTFKISFASCLAGFMLALVISHYDHSAIIHENKLLKAEQKQIENKTFAMKPSKSKVLLKEANTSKVQRKDNTVSYYTQEPIKEKTLYSLADEGNNSSKLSELSEQPIGVDNNAREIPGASYSNNKKNKSVETISKMELAMAPRPVRSRSSRRAKTVVCSQNSLKNEKKGLVDQSLVTAFDNHVEEDSVAFNRESFIGSSETDSELIVSETKAKQIENLITKNNIQVSSGPINVKDWAIQGIITAQYCKKILPPYGKHWFVEKSGAQIKVLLKKDKDTK